jgi:prepilin-type processing-associated H-X9-DG protein
VSGSPENRLRRRIVLLLAVGAAVAVWVAALAYGTGAITALILIAVVLGLPAFLLAWAARHAFGCFRQRRGRLAQVTAIAILLIVSLFALFTWASWWAVYSRSRESSADDECRVHLKALLEAVRAYAADHRGTFPVAASWSDLVAARVTDPNAFLCPAKGKLLCGYAYNSALSGLRADQLAHPASVLVLFESDRGWNAAGDRTLLPKEPRHYQSDNYGFADGHVRRLQRSRLSSVRWEPLLKTGARSPRPVPQ